MGQTWYLFFFLSRECWLIYSPLKWGIRRDSSWVVSSWVTGEKYGNIARITGSLGHSAYLLPAGHSKPFMIWILPSIMQYYPASSSCTGLDSKMPDFILVPSPWNVLLKSSSFEILWVSITITHLSWDCFCFLTEKEFQPSLVFPHLQSTSFAVSLLLLCVHWSPPRDCEI